MHTRRANQPSRMHTQPPQPTEPDGSTPPRPRTRREFATGTRPRPRRERATAPRSPPTATRSPPTATRSPRRPPKGGGGGTEGRTGGPRGGRGDRGAGTEGAANERRGRGRVPVANERRGRGRGGGASMYSLLGGFFSMMRGTRFNPLSSTLTPSPSVDRLRHSPIVTQTNHLSTFPKSSDTILLDCVSVPIRPQFHSTAHITFDYS